MQDENTPVVAPEQEPADTDTAPDAPSVENEPTPEPTPEPVQADKA